MYSSGKTFSSSKILNQFDENDILQKKLFHTLNQIMVLNILRKIF